MSNDSDTAEGLIREMTRIVQRAIALGERQGERAALEKVIRAVNPAVASTVGLAQPPLPLTPPQDDDTPAHTKRRFPYGHVTKTVEQALRIKGSTRSKIGAACRDIDPEIDDDSARWALKRLARARKVTVDAGGLYQLVRSAA